MGKNELEQILLKRFTGTKTVLACSMSRKQAEEIIGRKVYPDSDEREDEDGYLVEYLNGYLSWSPKWAFEETYMVSETYIDRMWIEQSEVMNRYLSERTFSFTQKFRSLSEEKRTLLRKQLDHMENYLYILSRRLELEIQDNDHLAEQDAPVPSGEK